MHFITTNRSGLGVGLVIGVALSVVSAQPGAALPAESQVTAVPEAERARLKLAPFYTQYHSMDGLPIVGSARVNPYALKEAAFLIRQMLGTRPAITRAMVQNDVRFTVMAVTEMTTDVPEHAHLTPKAYWDRRARGLGATRDHPCVSCGEENLLGLGGDPYSTENILIHEFAHAVHELGIGIVDPSFDDRLRAAYAAAMGDGLWKGTYAASNKAEYWAEGVQSWFDCNRANDSSHGEIDTREELKNYDPRLARLVAEVFGDGSWRYQRPAERGAASHLEGFDATAAPAFAWPATAPAATTRAAS